MKKKITSARYQTFGDALRELKESPETTVIHRQGWNGKGMFVFERPEFTADAETLQKLVSVPPVAKHFLLEIGAVFSAYLCISGPTGIVSSWVPSSSDLNGNDWLVTQVTDTEIS